MHIKMCYCIPIKILIFLIPNESKIYNRLQESNSTVIFLHKGIHQSHTQ